MNFEQKRTQIIDLKSRIAVNELKLLIEQAPLVTYGIKIANGLLREDLLKLERAID